LYNHVVAATALCQVEVYKSFSYLSWCCLLCVTCSWIVPLFICVSASRTDNWFGRYCRRAALTLNSVIRYILLMCYTSAIFVSN